MKTGSFTRKLLPADLQKKASRLYRAEFLLNAARALHPGAQILVKDVQPGHPIARLGLSCDKYLNGDRGVALISAERLCELSSASLAQHTAKEIGLLEVDRPNYLVQLQFI